MLPGFVFPIEDSNDSVHRCIKGAGPEAELKWLGKRRRVLALAVPVLGKLHSVLSVQLMSQVTELGTPLSLCLLELC